MKPDPLADIRAALDQLRQQNGVQKGDVFDHILRTVEALGVGMAALSVNAGRIVEEGQRQVGAIVSAAMTRQALWRLAILPATIGSSVTLLLAFVIFAFVMHDIDVQRSADRTALIAEFDRLHDERAVFQTEMAHQHAELATEKAQLQASLPGLLLAQAERLTASARGLVQMEAQIPGFIDWLAQNGRATMTLWHANGGTLCPQVLYQGPTAMCAYPKR